MVRLARISKLYRLVKLVKLTRIMRMATMFQKSSKFMDEARDKLKFGKGFERLIFLILISFMLVHFMTCIWIFLA